MRATLYVGVAAPLVEVVTRIGLTLQTLQHDLARFRPSLVLLDCHGTREGCLLLEDGRGRTDFVPCGTRRTPT